MSETQSPQNRHRIALEFESAQTLAEALRYIGASNAPVFITSGQVTLADGRKFEIWDQTQQALTAADALAEDEENPMSESDSQPVLEFVTVPAKTVYEDPEKFLSLVSEDGHRAKITLVDCYAIEPFGKDWIFISTAFGTKRLAPEDEVTVKLRPGITAEMVGAASRP